MVAEDKLTSIKELYYQLQPELKEETWNFLMQKFSLRVIPKNDYIVKQGEVCNYVSYITKGLIKYSCLTEEKEYIGQFFFDNSYVSEYESFLTRKPSRCFMQALEETECIDLSYDDLQVLYKNFPESQKVGRLIAESLFIMLSERNSSLLMETPEQRYLKLLRTRPKVVQNIPQYMIASYLGVTPEALSRIRKRIVESKI